ncbi:MAG TPA: holo-ACP synthase [Kofleriaceae bacterium]|jgi:holo-[acyl-carrier protein] synthase|nr:holo-ACP synthase [Kofleriaceae bacterium]
MSGLRVGVDLVQTSRIAESIATFGDKFVKRVFTDDEIAYASSAPELAAMRFAARFAAKEAAKKALGVADAGIGWRDIEVRRAPSGAVELALHGPAAQVDTDGLAVSLSHEGDYATAVVVTYVRGTSA